jgi:hypothetical protein
MRKGAVEVGTNYYSKDEFFKGQNKSNFGHVFRCHSYKMRNKPFWHDYCNHVDGSYVGSAEYYHSGANIEKMDVYLFEDVSCGRQSVCIRTGSDCSDYISPGGLFDMMMSAARHGGVYSVALDLIDQSFSFRAEKRESRIKSEYCY